MRYQNRCAKINVKVLIILILVAAAVGVSLVLARQTRRSILSETSLAAGEAALESKDWKEAAKNYRDYLVRNPDDVAILRKYGQACLSIRPLDASAVTGAISGYRRIVQLAPDDEVAYEKLVMLYGAVGNFEELASIARVRLEHDPNDLKAPLWLAEALARLNKTADARQTLQTFIDKLDALPDKYVEYVRACVQMSQLAASEASPQPQVTAGGEDSPQPPTPLDWLNRAVDYSPEFVEALVCRAEFCRRTARAADTNEPDRSALLALARQDLEAAGAKVTDDPRIRFLLATEWMAHNELDRAAAELQEIEKGPQEKLEQNFMDVNDWTVARFLLTSELAIRKGTTAQTAALADEVLKSLTEKRHRAQALPSAIQLYVGAGRALEARQSLDEYLGLISAQEGSAESPPKLAELQALVAGAENKPYAVIDALEPVAGNELSSPGLWRLLAEAYDRTGQTGRAVGALVHYNRLNPQDKQAMQELARQYSKLGDWKKAFDTAGIAESLGSTDITLKLLRIGAGVNLAVAGRESARAEELKKLSAELADLRRAYPDQVDIRILQAVIADYSGGAEEVEKELKLAVEECKEPLKAEMQLARYYLRAKRVSEAVSTCEKACKDHSNIAEPWLALADVHTANADYDSARNCLKLALNTITEGREKRTVSINLALLELTHGDRATGINLLNELASQDKQEIQARLLLLGIREVRQDAAAAERLIGELRQAEGESGLWWRLHQSSLWLSSDNWSSKQQDIANLLGYCIDEDPVWSAPVLLLAAMYERLGDFRRVEETYQRGLLANPSASDVADRYLVLLEQQGRFSDAENVLQKVEINPLVASAWQVRMALGTKDFSRAIDELKLRASNDDRDSDSRIQLARLVYQETRDADLALGYLKQAEAIASGSRTLAAVRASILKGEGKSAEALRVLDDYVATHNDFDAYWMRAVYLAEEGKLDLAEEDYKKLTTFTQNGPVGFEVLGNFYASTQELDEGVAAIEKGLIAYPEDLRLKRRLMQMLFLRAQTQDRERALEILEALEEQLPQDTELITVRAAQILKDPTPQSLATIRGKLENAVKLEPRAVNAHLALIAVVMRQREYKAACDYAVQALGSNPDNTALLSARAGAELALGYTPMAVKLAHQALKVDPNNTEAMGVIVDGALRSGDQTLLAEARTLVDAALGRSPAEERLLISRSHILAALEAPKTAIPELEAYCQTKEGGSSIAAIVTLADLYRLAGDAEQAGQWIERAERLDSKHQAVVHARFLWLVSQKRFEGLANISSAYISAKEQDLATVLRAASTLLSLDSMDLKKEAARLFEHAATLEQTSLDAQLGLASSLYQTGDVEGAEKTYRRLLEQHPDDIRALNDLAWILQEHDQKYADALELANKGLRLAPEDLHLLDTRGTILSNMPDRLADARKDFEEIVKLSSSDARRQAKALLQLGRVCAKLNDIPQARQHLQSAMDIDNKNHVFTSSEQSQIAELNSVCKNN